MIRKLSIILFVVLTSAFTILAQTTNQQQKAVILKPVFYVEDITFAVNALNSIEITGTEVDNFLKAKSTLLSTLQKAQKQTKNQKDTIQIDIEINIAQSIVNFLGKAKFSASQAEQYKRFIDAIVESTKKYKE